MERKRKMGRPAMWMGGLAVLFLYLLSMENDLKQVRSSLSMVAASGFLEDINGAVYHNFLPVLSFVREKPEGENRFLENTVTGIMPLYGYAGKQRAKGLLEAQYRSLEGILLAEGEEGITGGEDAVIEDEPPFMETSPTEEPSLNELLTQENEAARESTVITGTEEVLETGFVGNTRQVEIALGDLTDYEILVDRFYTIDANTMAGSDQLNAEKLMDYDATVKKTDPGPQILLYHTHSQETFSDSIPGDPATSIVGVGEQLAKILTEEYGYQVLHHTGEYDVETRDDAYAKSLPALEEILSQNPTIQVVIDLHRDQMPEEKKLVMDLNGRPTARFMFFNGLSRTKKTGDISYLYNENQAGNLAFSFQMQLAANEYYPGLTRKIYLKGYRYNMHLKPKSLLIELGAQNNTLEEVLNACDPLAHILDLVLTGEAD